LIFSTSINSTHSSNFVYLVINPFECSRWIEKGW